MIVANSIYAGALAGCSSVGVSLSSMVFLAFFVLVAQGCYVMPMTAPHPEKCH